MAKASTRIKKDDLLAEMNLATSALWTSDDVDDVFKCSAKAARSMLYRLHRMGLIKRHKENDPESGLPRYAISIKKENDLPWKLDQKRSASQKSKKTIGPIKASKRKEMVTAKELRMMISQVIRALSNLEDTICPALEQLEEREKQISKIKNLF